jgi:translation initiation factor 2B subunit (eIF-2B alpha/beta/delta family)
MWKHYVIDHFVQPTEEERTIIMTADPEKASVNVAYTFGKQEMKLILYVEKTDKGYTHRTGEKPDKEFIGKLEEILKKIEPEQTREIKLPKFDF